MNTLTRSSTPLVTIALPTFNRRRYLERALQSSLDQTYPRVEVIVSDNDSNDGTFEFLSGIKNDRLTILRQPTNLGMMGNWNACLEKAAGDYFLLLSDDDYLHPEALSEMMRQLGQAEERNVGFVYGRTVVVDENERVLRMTPKAASNVTPPADLMLSFFRHQQPMYPCAILLKTDDLRDGGGYPGSRFPLAADAYVWTNIAAGGRSAAFVEEPYFFYRQHTSNQSKQVVIDDWVSNVEALLDAICSKLRSRGEAPAESKIAAAGYDYLSSMVSGLIVQECRRSGNRSAAIANFKRWRKYFVRGRGPRYLLKGAARILLPLRLERALRQRNTD